MPNVLLHEQSHVAIGFDALMLGDVALAKALADSANAGDATSAELFDQLRRGLSHDMLEKVAAAARVVRRVQQPELDRKTWRFYWSALLPEAENIPTSAAAWALVTLRIHNAKLRARLHRCVLAECRRFFVGDARSKWCSTTCGSKFRVRAKRKRDRR